LVAKRMGMVTAEQKFVIQLENRGRGRTFEQNVSMILGSIYVVGGIFQINPYHNIVHIGLGAFWLLGAFALTPAGNEGLNIAIGGVYALASVLGFLGLLLVTVHPTWD
jgi:hypothetical protein